MTHGDIGVERLVHQVVVELLDHRKGHLRRTQVIRVENTRLPCGASVWGAAVGVAVGVIARHGRVTTDGIA